MKPQSQSPVVMTFSDFRRNVGRVLRKVEAGQDVILSFRGKPVIVILSWDNYLTRYPEAHKQLLKGKSDLAAKKARKRSSLNHSRQA